MRRLLLSLLGLLATACGGSPAPPALDPGPLIEGAVAAMESVETARFEMTRAGAPVTVEGLEFDGAVGRYTAPASAQAVLRLRAGDIAVEMGTISVGERTWLTNPLTGRWEELRPGTGFNPAVLFDPSLGWVPLLEDLGDVSFVGTEDGRHHLAATVPAARVEALTAGLASAQPVPVDLWLDTAAGHILRLEFSTVSAAGASEWVITLSGFGEPVQIEPPATG